MKLTKEQKEAIEELSKKAVIYNYEERDYPNMICFKKDMIIILNLIEKLQKENEELNKENEHLHREINRRIKLKIENEKIVDTQFIYKQKIKDKIEELKQKAINYGIFIDKNESFNIESKISVLKELLGDK